MSNRAKSNDLDYMPSNVRDHHVNYGRLIGSQTYKADCTCGWSQEGTHDEMRAAIVAHKTGKQTPR